MNWPVLEAKQEEALQEVIHRSTNLIVFAKNSKSSVNGNSIFEEDGSSAFICIYPLFSLSAAEGAGICVI